jgi:hypothetical protein
VVSGLGQQVWTFVENDYLFGADSLHMIVHGVDWSRPRTYDSQVWFDVRGIEVSADGRIIGPREVMVRASRLRPHAG